MIFRLIEKNESLCFVVPIAVYDEIPRCQIFLKRIKREFNTQAVASMPLQQTQFLYKEGDNGSDIALTSGQ